MKLCVHRSVALCREEGILVEDTTFFVCSRCKCGDKLEEELLSRALSLH